LQKSGNVDFTMGTRSPLWTWWVPLGMAHRFAAGNTTVSRWNCSGRSALKPMVFRATPRRQRHAFPIYAKNDPLATIALPHQYRRRCGIQFWALQRIARWLRDWFAEYKLRLGSPEIPSVSGRVGQARLRYLLDHTDDP